MHFPYYNAEMGASVDASLGAAHTLQTFEIGVLSVVYAPAASAGTGGYEETKQHLPQDEA